MVSRDVARTERGFVVDSKLLPASETHMVENPPGSRRTILSNNEVDGYVLGRRTRGSTYGAQGKRANQRS